ncbi:MAG: hypothetical protein M3O70_05670 [Actinomycetota bacterium]|nr:hypothetical protein [Actinomycetota bacterium]
MEAVHKQLHVLGCAGGALGDLTGDATTTPAVRSDQFVLVDTVLISAGEAGYDAVLAPAIRSTAQVCDTDDGQVEGEEAIKSWFDVIGVDAPTVDEAFAVIDTDGDGKVSVDQIADAVHGYHMGRLDASLLGH